LQAPHRFRLPAWRLRPWLRSKIDWRPQLPVAPHTTQVVQGLRLACVAHRRPETTERPGAIRGPGFWPHRPLRSRNEVHERLTGPLRWETFNTFNHTLRFVCLDKLVSTCQHSDSPGPRSCSRLEVDTFSAREGSDFHIYGTELIRAAVLCCQSSERD